jgi:mannose-6-phosphate isomerase
MAVEGDFSLLVAGESYHHKKGSTVLLPAVITDYQLDGQASVLEISIS